MPKRKDDIWSNFSEPFKKNGGEGEKFKSSYCRCSACHQPVIAASGRLRDHWNSCPKRSLSKDLGTDDYQPSRKMGKTLAASTTSSTTPTKTKTKATTKATTKTTTKTTTDNNNNNNNIEVVDGMHANISQPSTTTPTSSSTSSTSSLTSSLPTFKSKAKSKSSSASTKKKRGAFEGETYSVYVARDYMKFNAAHFIAYKGFREHLHGHNYHVSVTITGQKPGDDGYVVDFGLVKSITRNICKELNESFLVPMESEVLQIDKDDALGTVTIKTEDEKLFCFPMSDCSFLPITHSSAEKIAAYLSDRIIDAFTLKELQTRRVTRLEVSVAEANNQLATFSRPIALP